jgi:hypothetical protein
MQESPMNEADLQKLDKAVAHLLRQESFPTTIERLKIELAESKEAFVWSTVALDAIPCELPAGIKSCWIFHLRKDVPSGCYLHPNSVQHMVMVTGQGLSIVGGMRRTMASFASSEKSLADKWYVIEQGVPHEFIPERVDMTVVSFHTCEASELEEIACETGGKRLYEGPDA